MSAIKTPPNDAPAAEWGALAVSISGWQYPSPMPPRCLVDDEWGPLPDPDHWAWEGWLRRMLGDTFAHVDADGIGYVVCVIVNGDTVEGTGRTIGRACISAAAALGRWPGGEG